MAKFHLTPLALSSMQLIGEYTESQWGIAQRNKYLKELDNTFHELANSPKLGKLRNEIKQGMRSYQQGKHVIFYMVEPEQIVVLNILHESMLPELRF